MNAAALNVPPNNVNISRLRPRTEEDPHPPVIISIQLADGSALVIQMTAGDFSRAVAAVPAQPFEIVIDRRNK